MDKEPTVIAAAIFAVVNFVIAAGSWTVEPDTLAQGNTALVLVLALFVRSRSTSNSTAQVLVENAQMQAQAQVTADTAEFLLAAKNDEQHQELEALRAAVAPAVEATKKATSKKAAAKKAARPAEH